MTGAFFKGLVKSKSRARVSPKQLLKALNKAAKKGLWEVPTE